MNGLKRDTALVLGLGNTLLTDDGAGVHVARRLAGDAATPDWLLPVDGGTMGFRLTRMIGEARYVLIVDAADFGAAPGSLRVLDEAELAGHIAGARKTSAHEAGLADLLNLARLENFAPRHLAVLAIQPAVIDWGEKLSGPVENSIAAACIMAKTTVLHWRRCG